MRRHLYRPLLTASGLVLFATLLAPVLHADSAPLLASDQAPVSATPYLLGLATATFGFVTGPRSRLLAFTTARVLLALVIVATAAVAITAAIAVHAVPIAALFELILACGFAVVLGVTGGDDATLAAFAIALGTVQAGWLVIVASPLPATADRVAAGAALGTLLGGVLWRRDLAPRHGPP